MKEAWPPILDFKEQLENLREFYKATDHKFVNRVICSVCGTFDITTQSIQSFQRSPKILIDNKSILNSHHLINFKNHDFFNFTEFPELNGCVLDIDGFNASNHTVNSIKS